jgi:hypothetical protein
MTFFNTTNETGRDLYKYRAQALSQQEQIRAMWQRRPTLELTASQVLQHLQIEGWITKNTPLTSIRRAMTNLATEGFLEKTTKKRIGPYGRPECTYRRPTRTLTLV